MSALLENSASPSILLILNPVSGKFKSKNYCDSIVSSLKSAGYSVALHETAGRLDATEFTKKNASEYDAVVCCGGDGTFSETVSGIISGGHSCPIGYIPAGTTNDFANTLGIPPSVGEAVKCIANGSPCALDIGQFGTDNYFTYIASFGAFTKSAYTTPQQLKNMLGHFAYVLEGAREIGNIEFKPLKIMNDRIEYSGDFVFGAITNSTSVGGMLKYQSNSVGLSDGMFEALFIRRPENLFELSEIFRKLAVQDFNDKNVMYFKTKHIEITTSDNSSIAWTTDGEFAGEHKSITIRNLPSAVKILK